MADGTQHEFNLPRHLPATRLRPGEIVVDLFAGGGGASVALEAALQRPVDIAINHDEFAVGMHAANHPLTKHMREDVWVADPREIAGGRMVGWLHASPDCTHFSQARGGQPRSRKTRSLSWVVVKWAGRLHAAGLGPRYISLENVEQILTWGPLIAKRCKATSRVLKMDGTVAAPGEVVPVGNQQLVPDKKRAGQTWDRFVAMLRGLGYQVEWKKVIAADHGAGTSRKRLFLIARCDGRPIVWPAATHGPGRAQPYVTAADCIDWSIPGKSIFGRKKDLADATMRRIARGIKRYVIDAAEPFIVPATHHGSDRCNASSAPMPTITAAHRGELMVVQPVVAPVLTEHANASREAAWRTDEPLRTQCAQVKGGHFALASATLIQTGYGEAPGQAPRVPGLGKPVGTLVDGQKHGVVEALLAPHVMTMRNAQKPFNGGDEPTHTITAGGAGLSLVSAIIEQAYGGPNGNPAPARKATDPLGVITGSGAQQRVVEAHMAPSLSPEQEAGALRVAAFLVNYYGNGQPLDVRDPVDTITTRDRLALVTVHVRGVPYVIVDITLRMLTPPELYRAQGFPAAYIIDRTADGRKLTVSQQVRMVGNSVSPPPLFAIVDANLDEVQEPMRLAA
jgi:DNA (cytosine-5)-methyltransferase 1